MTPREALLPHETYCTRCGGEGRVPNEEPYISSTATVPRYTGMVDCPANCADGVVVNESRKRERGPGTVARDFAALRSAVTLARVEIEQQQDHIDRLIGETRAVREALERNVRELDLAKEESLRLHVLNRKQSDLLEDAGHELRGTPRSKEAIQ